MEPTLASRVSLFKSDFPEGTRVVLELCFLDPAPSRIPLGRSRHPELRFRRDGRFAIWIEHARPRLRARKFETFSKIIPQCHIRPPEGGGNLPHQENAFIPKHGLYILMQCLAKLSLCGLQLSGPPLPKLENVKTMPHDSDRPLDQDEM